MNGPLNFVNLLRIYIYMNNASDASISNSSFYHQEYQKNTVGYRQLLICFIIMVLLILRRR